MRAISEKLWVRVLALILFFLFSAGAYLSLYIYSFALRDGWYGKQDYTFADSQIARVYTIDALSFVANNLIWLGDPGNETLGAYGGAAFSYVIEDYHTGRKYADTTTDDSYFVTEWPTDIELKEDSGRSYRLRGYVNLPVQPYDGCYREYYVFTQLFSLRQYYLPLGVLLVLLAAAMLGICVGGAARLGKKGSATLLGRAPFDGAVVALYIGSILFVNFLYGRFVDGLQVVLELLSLSLYSFRRLFTIWSAGVLLALLVNQLCAHTFYERLLLRQLLRRLSHGTLLLILFFMHLIPLLMLGAAFFGIGLFAYRSIWILLWLIGLDMIALVCAVRWYREQKRFRQATEALAQGELNYKLDVERLHFVWRDLGRQLNSIGDGMSAAVEERLRSERMKTELITNVSHDLKTPLTSIINYIDMLKERDLLPETQREYLDVLDRQSAKLKKLTEDVVEASKAASGVLPVHPELLDVAELLSQSVGEYAERLTQAGVTPVIHVPEQEAHILADGRLLGRVLDNFITNIIKYAQPGTRAYFDLAADGQDTVIAVKNTSRAQLDMPAEELMERFVRGDSSRSTEGSGLGLSIARGLTELMGGQMRLTLDGDLFKAEVIFPTAAGAEQERQGSTPAAAAAP